MAASVRRRAHGGMRVMTTSEERRDELLGMLRGAPEPLRGSDLASSLGVSRQAIVNDIAILRAKGEPIVGSPRGYMLVGGPSVPGVDAMLACRHDRDGSREELAVLVRHGITVMDVVVEHPLYGEVRANLLISTLDDVERYTADLLSQAAQPLSSLTGGVHLHHVRAPTMDALEAASEELEAAGFLLKEG